MTTRSWKSVLVATGVAIVLNGVVPAAQTLIVTPSCGVPGKTTVCIRGSGWAEPVPVCRYKFFFDGAQVAPDQPDGLFGPPSTNFLVPAGKAPGTYQVRVELRLNSPDNLLQVREKPFKVVAAVKQPWTVTTKGARIDIKFDPTDVCDVTPCTKIRFIQVYRQFAIKKDKTEELTLDSFWGLPAGRDADFTASKFALDRIFGKTEPYYGGNGAGTGASTIGTNVGTNTPATMMDEPGQPDGSFPAGTIGIRVEFEVAMFCAAGDDRGRYFGKVLWKWERTEGSKSPGTATFISSSRDQPSANFTAAVAKWVANRSFSLPTAVALSCP
jgi:hypothetical protein